MDPFDARPSSDSAEVATLEKSNNWKIPHCNNSQAFGTSY